MRFLSRLLMATLLSAIAAIALAADLDENFAGRKAIIINSCPYVELSKFTFGNRYADRRSRFETSMSWKNVGTQPLIAFEIVVLKYDAFDQRLMGSRWTVTGTNSADWKPLPPGASSADGTSGYGTEEVFTAIAYVRTARLQDGTVWRVDSAALMAELKKISPTFKEFGALDPDPKPRKE